MDRIVPAGTVEFIEVELTSDVTLDTQPVEVTIQLRAAADTVGGIDWPSTVWWPGEWIGAAGLVRRTRVNLGTAPVILAAGVYAVFTRVSMYPENPITRASGTLVLT